MQKRQTSVRQVGECVGSVGSVEALQSLVGRWRKHTQTPTRLPAPMFRLRQTWLDLLQLLSVSPPPRPPLSISALPAELLLAVFASLADDDAAALRACTLVCSEWRALAQPRLFHEIVLSTADMRKSLQFQQFMLSSPTIRAAVRAVTVHFPDLDSWAPDRRRAANLMADVLELLPRPERLRLYGARFSDYRIKWSRLSNHLKNSIRTLLHRPSMTTLLIDGWVLDVNHPEFNTIFADASHSLTSISLLDISDGIWGVHEVPAVPSRRLALDKLTVTNTFSKDVKFIEWLSRPESIFDLEQLTSLHVVESRDDASVSLLTSLIGPSLEHLEVNISYTPQDSSIGLSTCTGLRSLSLSFGVFYTELYYSSLPWICATLDTLSPHNALSSLSLSLYITHPRNTNARVFPPPPVGRFNYERWARLGAVLRNPKFAGVGEVRVQLVHHGIDARGYSQMAAGRMGEVGERVRWRFLRDDSPDVEDATPT
ncbi:hypothetical protein DFP72DRAFT_531516 [Ephemerocybe angulata]|uniref:F-box domain-containing protein n=1 Tax=Ephemerocybe angulata TaxID=980116 RepID=A0A8H6IFN8_9AGAR|nr:hypothetical protein DFP72DRAFT_531516 [Tulosesus angulatus]